MPTLMTPAFWIDSGSWSNSDGCPEPGALAALEPLPDAGPAGLLIALDDALDGAVDGAPDVPPAGDGVLDAPPAAVLDPPVASVDALLHDAAAVRAATARTAAASDLRTDRGSCRIMDASLGWYWVLSACRDVAQVGLWPSDSHVAHRMLSRA
ncbi:MAG TPA: hypothetical protein VFM01_10095 [Nakamurella sp.]|nr:hypothetical protein [Nakamurella sp.]